MPRTARTLARSLGGAAVFVVALSAGALLHLDTPTVRRLVTARVNGVLASALAGRITIERVGHLGVAGLDGADAHVQDPDGKTVLRVEGVHARVSTLTLLRSLVGGGDIVVDVGDVSVARTTLSLDAAPDGTLRLVKAFAPRSPGAPSTAARGVRVLLPRVHVEHATVVGRPGPGDTPSVDADVERLDAAVQVAPGTLDIDVSRAHVLARGLPGGGATAQGDLEAHVAQPSARGGDGALRAAWRGVVGAVAERIEASYEDGVVEASIDVPSAAPDDVRALLPAWPATAPASVHAEVAGTLPRLWLRARASVGDGAATVEGPVQLGGETRASLRLDATAVDAHALSASAPASRLDAGGQALLVSGPAGAAATWTLALAGGSTLGATRLPAATLLGRLERDPAAANAVTGTATLTVAEPGAPAQVAVRLAPKGSSFELAFDASAAAPRLDAVRRLAGALHGSASASAHGTIDLGAGRVDAQLQATASSVATSVVQTGDAKLAAHVTGRLDAPWLDARLEARHLDIGALHFARAHAEAHGPPAHAPLTLGMAGYGTEIRARADVSLAGGTTLREVEVVVDDKGRTVKAGASLVRVAPAEVRVEDAAVYGLGRPIRGTVRLSPGTVLVQARSKHVDLERVARFAGLSGKASGRASFDVDAAFRRDGAQGRLELDFSQASFGSLHDARGHVDASLQGRRVSGHVTANLGAAAALDVQTSSFQVGGTAPLDATFWRRAWGQADVQAHVDLAQLAAQLPPGTLPFARVAGVVDVQGRLGRDSATDMTPAVDLTARTAGVTLTGSGTLPWRVDGVDATAHLLVDGEDGHTTFDAQLADRGGALATLSAASDDIPYARLFGTERLADVLRATPFQATLALPERDLASWPSALGLRGLHGALQASVGWRGTVTQPTVDVTASLRGGKTDVTLLAIPLDLQLTGHYDGARAQATLRARDAREPVLQADAAIDVRAGDLVARAGDLPWSASGRAQLTGFPLQSIGPLDDRQVRGRASGQVTLDGLHDDARASVALTLDGLQVGDIGCRSARAQATLDGHAFDAMLRVDQDDGYAEGRAHAGAHWGAALAPALDASQAASVAFTASQFRAAVLWPFVSNLFTQLDGRIDARATLDVDPQARTIKPQGTIALKDGVFELNAFGGEFHDASAKAVLTPDGVVRLENVTARGLSGQLQAAATARFDGLKFGGARAQLLVPTTQPLPLVFEGVNMGTVDARMSVAVDPTADRSGLDVSVDVPSMHVQLPLSSTHDVQALGDLADVRIGIQRGDEFVPESLEGGAQAAVAARATPIKVAVRLGSDVEVQRGTDLDVRLEGAPSVTLAQDVRASGQIRIVRGTIDVQGKPFTIDNGTVTFVGDDPSNPQVKLTATWTAPDDTRIYADFVGPLKTGKVTLRSEPARSQNEILALILFGTTDEQAPTSTGTSQEANSAVGAAGGAATQPINRALGGVNRMLDKFGVVGGISTKIDTSQASPRPEVELQIAQDISLQIAWVIGVPPPGSNPDTTLLTLSWRFLRKWSLQTTVGDAGTSILDLVWQHRY